MSPRKRLSLLVVFLVVLVLVSAFLYMAGMRYLENDPRDFWRSLEWAAETLTTTGFGSDSTWDHPLMVLLVVMVQFMGVFLVFLVVPVYLIPFLEERFEARIPVRVSKKIEGHVVVYRYGPAVESLLGQLEGAEVPTLVVEQDEAVARRLMDRGQRVILGRLEDEALEAASLPTARALIANGEDAENAAVLLAARQLRFGGDLLALAEDPFHRRPLQLAGASVVFTPRHVLGAALAARASPRISPRISGLQQLGRQLQVAEMKIAPSSPLAGVTLAEAGIGARTGASVIGQWVEGELVAPLTGRTRLSPGGILVAVGSEDSLRRLDELAEGVRNLERRGPFVVAGYGEVGKKVVELLRTAEEEVLVIDRRPQEGVDWAEDVLDPKVLERPEVAEAQAVLLALDKDAVTLFATVVVKEHAPEAPVIARVNQAENVDRIHRAGADFALSISQVSGQILARRLLKEKAVALEPGLKVLEVPVEGLVGSHPAELRLRERTGCSVVGVERGEEVITELGQGFAFQAGDSVFVSGSTEDVDAFEERMRS